MDALTRLARFDRLYAGVTAAIGGAALAGLLLAGLLVDEGGPGVGWLLAGIGALIVVVTVAMVALLLVTARRIEQGRWRGVQTALAILSVASNPPVGTAFGLISLWICWMHPGARARFQGRPEPAADPALAERFAHHTRLARRLILGGGVVYAVLSFGALAAVGGVLSWGQQDAPVEVTADTVDFSGMYGEEIDRDDINGVELRGGLPTITLRANGYALGDTLLGWFMTREYGKVKLLVHTDEGPFLYIHHKDGLLIWASADPDRTRAVHEQLMEAPGAP